MLHILDTIEYRIPVPYPGIKYTAQLDPPSSMENLLSLCLTDTAKYDKHAACVISLWCELVNCLSDIVIKWLAPLLCICYVFFSNVSPENGFPDRFCSFLQPQLNLLSYQ